MRAVAASSASGGGAAASLAGSGSSTRNEKPPDISAGQSIDNHRFPGPGGPVPTVEVHTSFNEQRPVVTSVQFFWPGRRAPGGTTSGTYRAGTLTRAW
jgi:hypothetical protein